MFVCVPQLGVELSLFTMTVDVSHEEQESTGNSGMKKSCFKQLCKTHAIQLAVKHKSRILHLVLTEFLFDTSKKSLLDFHSEICNGYLFKLGESAFKDKLFQGHGFAVCLVQVSGHKI